MRKWRKIIGLVVIAVFSLSMAAGCGAEKKEATATEPVTIELKIGSGHANNVMIYTQAATEFFETEIAKRVAEKTNYRIKWTEAYGGTLAKLGEELEATETGILDVAVGAFGFEPAKLFIMNMCYYVPFSTQDPYTAVQAQRKLMDAHPEIYDKLWESYNAKFLGLAPSGSYELITKFPVTKVADLKKHKIAAAGPNLTLFHDTGAVPVQSTFPDGYTAMQTGVYEGWVVWPDAANRYKFYEVADHFTLTGFGCGATGGIWIGLNTWNKLPKEVQDIFVEVGLEYEKASSDMTKEYDEAGLEKMKAEGVKISELSAEAKAEWAALLPNVPQEKAEEALEMGYPKELWNEYLNNMKALGHVFPRDWKVE